MDQEIRNKLRNVVTQCRKLLEESISRELEGKYGIFAKKDQVTADPNAKMTHLTEEEQAARKDILDHFAHIKACGFKPKDALDQLVREIAFTHLNRLCAYKMMEAREVYIGEQKFREAVSRGVNSNGVKFYLAEHPEEERLFNTGHQDVAYRHFLDWLGGLLSDEIGVLFNPNDPANRLYPRQKTLDEVLDLLNGGGIKPEEVELREEWPKIWSQDETIGWVYQYFTPKELRDAARDPKKGGSQAPRNSYELAFRNQFFTPRYVVEFLTDNTLGRIWYEMRKGNTKLKDQCRYMVRRPTEIFLKEGEQLPRTAAKGRDDLSLEELLKLPVHIPHRPKKAPQELKILDPACGSGHFLLYCFDLLLTIYLEAYSDPDLGPALQKLYPKLEDLVRDVPRLILAHNLHGIDIDQRCTQIAALALWLRCQRAYQEMGLKKDRPKIKRSNFVCAEPMPGEENMLKEFVGQLEPKLLGQLVEVVFGKMKLAGEAGSLLKIEEEIREALSAAKKQWVRETVEATDRKGHPLLFTQSVMDRLAGKTEQLFLFDLSDITDDQFFEHAEAKLVEALRNYAGKAQNGQRFQRRLFSDDAERGFAFVDLCHHRFSVVLMNPPFGIASKPSAKLVGDKYPIAKHDLYASFLTRGLDLLEAGGAVGAITNRTGFFLSDFSAFRETVMLDSAFLAHVADLGEGVLDGAKVATAAYTLWHVPTNETSESMWIRVLDRSVSQKGDAILDVTWNGKPFESFLNKNVYIVRNHAFTKLSTAPFAYWVSDKVRTKLAQAKSFEPAWGIARTGLQSLGADDIFIRAFWEVPQQTLQAGSRWVPFAKGGKSQEWYLPPYLVTNWEKDGEHQRSFAIRKYKTVSRKITGITLYFRPGLTYTTYTNLGFKPRVLPAGCIFSLAGSGVFTDSVSPLEALGYLNSSLVQFFLRMTTDGRKWDPGYVKRVPVPVGAPKLKDLSLRAIGICRAAGQLEECSREYVAPWRNLAISDQTFADLFANQLAIDAKHKNELVSLQAEIDVRVINAFGLDSAELTWLQTEVTHFSSNDSDTKNEGDTDDEKESPGTVSIVAVVKQTCSYAVGCAFGRWDIRYSTGKSHHAADDPFADLPACAPGILQDTGGLPCTDTPEGYALRINWDGVLVNDSEHQDDIVRRVRDVAQIIWREQADSIEEEACDILGVKELGDYFRKPGKGGFWDDHVARYTKNPRKAPIYWLLQSTRRNYALWLYYHRLDKDLLFKALVNYVEPKIRLETSRLDTIRSQKVAAGESGKDAKRLGKEFERQEDFLSELRDFEDKLRRAADLHLDPDLNDGVVLNIAPLRELVPWAEARNYWDELLKGEYEWSSIGKQLRQKGLVK